MKEFLQQWKESIIVPIYNNGDTSDCTIQAHPYFKFYAKLYQIFFPQGLCTHVDETIVDHQCVFRCNMSTVDQILHSSDTGEMMEVQ
jgi:hypothetical protein